MLTRWAMSHLKARRRESKRVVNQERTVFVKVTSGGLRVMQAQVRNARRSLALGYRTGTGFLGVLDFR